MIVWRCIVCSHVVDPSTMSCRCVTGNDDWEPITGSRFRRLLRFLFNR